MKKFLSFLLVICITVTCAVVLIGCGSSKPVEKDEATAVVEFSVNPEVQIVLDQNNNVMNVNYLSAETQQIFSRSNFIGSTAEEAGMLFAKIASDSGKIDIDKCYDEATDGTVVNVKIYCADDKLYEKLSKTITDATNKYFENYGIVAGAVASRMESIKNSLSKIDNSIITEDLTEEKAFELLEKKSQQLKDIYINLRTKTFEGIENLKTESEKFVKNTQKQMEELRVRISNLKAQLEEYKKEIAINKVAINELQSLIAKLEEQLNQFTESVDNIQTTLDGQIEEYLKEIREESKSFIEEEIEKANELFNSFKEKIQQHEQNFESNKEAILKKISDFQQSLKEDNKTE